jgi:hypothetical protein
VSTPRRLAALLAGALILCAAPAAAAPSTKPGEQVEEAKAPSGPQDIRVVIEQMRAAILRPGDTLEGWQTGGVNPDEALLSKGADKFFFLLKEGEQQEVSILTSRRIDDFAPARWRAIDSYGSPVAYAEDPALHFSPISSRYFVATRGTGAWQQGISCSKGVTHAILYEDPEAPVDKVDAQAAIGLFRIVLLALEGQTVCARYEGDVEQGWKPHYLLPDGRSLPELNKEESRITIVPAAPVETLVRAAPES